MTTLEIDRNTASMQEALAQVIATFATAAGVLKHSIPGDFQLGSVADVELVLSEQQTDVRR